MNTIECSVCEGSGFSGQGTGYDSICDNCGGKGELPQQLCILIFKQN